MSLTQLDLERLLEPSYLDGLPDAPVTDLRARRDECQRAETVLSYLRRVIQGEIDLVAAEIAGRAVNGRSDVGRLVDELPTILAAGAAVSGAVPAHVPLSPTTGDATPGDASGFALEEVLRDMFADGDGGETLPGGLLPGANICTFGDEELHRTLDRLRDEESVLSVQRHQLHHQIDAIQAAVVDRYKTGAADVDSLLR